jgi:alkanesulfonate monooxygenase SsuD/methylene tetrahydromethanopterin reductase-like flavin-dependent oxidoreductase (luciferase family)
MDAAIGLWAVPRGPRPQGPPVLIAAFGPRMLRLAARYADYWNTAWLGSAGTLVERRFALAGAERRCGAVQRFGCGRRHPHRNASQAGCAHHRGVPSQRHG